MLIRFLMELHESDSKRCLETSKVRKWSPEVSKSEPKGIKRIPIGTKREPKGTKREPKETVQRALCTFD